MGVLKGKRNSVPSRISGLSQSRNLLGNLHPSNNHSPNPNAVYSNQQLRESSLDVYQNNRNVNEYMDMSN